MPCLGVGCSFFLSSERTRVLLHEQEDCFLPSVFRKFVIHWGSRNDIVWLVRAVSHVGNEEQTHWSERSIGWKWFVPALGWAALSNEVMDWLTKTHGLVHRWWRLKPQWLLLAVNCLTNLGDKVRNGDGVYFVLVPLVLMKRRRKVSFIQPLLLLYVLSDVLNG